MTIRCVSSRRWLRRVWSTPRRTQRASARATFICTSATWLRSRPATLGGIPVANGKLEMIQFPGVFVPYGRPRHRRAGGVHRESLRAWRGRICPRHKPNGKRPDSRSSGAQKEAKSILWTAPMGSASNSPVIPRQNAGGAESHPSLSPGRPRDAGVVRQGAGRRAGQSARVSSLGPIDTVDVPGDLAFSRARPSCCRRRAVAGTHRL